jgi:hypothetical protein
MTRRPTPPPRTGLGAERPRVYAAHPVTSYGTDHERDRLACLARLLPGVQLFDPSGRYSSHAGWRRAWPRVLETLSGLVVFQEEDCTIGTGCLRELTDAITWGLPIAALEGEALHHITGIQFLAVPRRPARHAGRLVLGPSLGPGDFLPGLGPPSVLVNESSCAGKRAM